MKSAGQLAIAQQIVDASRNLWPSDLIDVFSAILIQVF